MVYNNSSTHIKEHPPSSLTLTTKLPEKYNIDSFLDGADPKSKNYPPPSLTLTTKLPKKCNVDFLDGTKGGIQAKEKHKKKVCDGLKENIQYFIGFTKVWKGLEKSSI